MTHPITTQNQQLINELFTLVSLLENSGDFIFTPVGLTVKTYAILSLISTGVDTSRDLLQGTYGTKPNMTKKLKFLEENGFIHRRVDEQDKRIFRFTLTEKSISSLSKISPMYECAIGEILSPSTEKEIVATLHTLGKWKRQLTKMLTLPKIEK